MAVINNPEMDKYKTYFTEKIKGKDGITRPITKVKYIKLCPQCGDDMEIDKYKSGSKFKPLFCRWKCKSSICGHSESEATPLESTIHKLEERDLKFGECIHHQNLASCEICNGV